MSTENRRKVMFTIYVEPDQHAALAALTEQTRVPMAVYVRDGIDGILQKARALGLLPPLGIPPQAAAEAVQVMQDGGKLPCMCGSPTGPHYHMDENKA
jgi:hypothetical protein